MNKKKKLLKFKKLISRKESNNLISLLSLKMKKKIYWKSNRKNKNYHHRLVFRQKAPKRAHNLIFSHLQKLVNMGSLHKIINL